MFDLLGDIFDSTYPLAPVRLPPDSSRSRPSLWTLTTFADADVRRTVKDDELTLSVDLPGAKKEDVELTFEANGTLCVKSKRADLQLESTHRCSLPDEWDRDSAEAALDAGVLTVKLRKLERAKPRKLLLK
jgi:HSP20 family molecular chaperone IbpA